MKFLGMLLLAGVVLAALQTALSVLVVIGIIAIIIGVFYRPAETFGFLLFGVFANLLQVHPVATIWLMSLALIVTLVLRRQGHEVPPPPVPLPDGQEGNGASEEVERLPGPSE